jgi:gamma-glutamyl:cysteine ligase YbdK (ATP-grasp superfamily)
MARMGQELQGQHFHQRDFARFGRRLRAETDLLHDWFETARFSTRPPMAGLELEAWLVTPDGRPAPCNDAFLARLALDTVVHELAQFNVELNVAPQPLAGTGLAALERDLAATWDRCRAVAVDMGLRIVSIGILPTLRDDDLGLATRSTSARYRALNEQVMRQRHGRPIRLRVEGRETLDSTHHDVMLEAGTTSFQAHLQVSPEQAARAYDASVIASAPLVALAANSPFLFGRSLWEETRVPLFEQAVDVGSYAADWRGNVPRVGFGTGWAGFSLAQCFAENLSLFPPMLPIALEAPADKLPHLRLHNGTIWRWNRPLIGFDDDGTPHLRIEQRVMAAGTSITDMMADLVAFYGLARALMDADPPPESRMAFEAAKSNFYAAARLGRAATVRWLDGEDWPLERLWLEALLPMARDGLASLGVDGALAARHLETVEARVRTGMTGAAWQRAMAERCGRDVGVLTREYMARQAGGAPVHAWAA